MVLGGPQLFAARIGVAPWTWIAKVIDAVGRLRIFIDVVHERIAIIVIHAG